MQIEAKIMPGMDSHLFADMTDAAEDSQMRIETFIGTRFIPDHVEHKHLAGRMHYHAILKHVLQPETVDRLFTPYAGVVRSRLHSLPDWPYLDDVRLCDLSPNHVRQLISSASARGYSPQTVKHIRNVISAVVAHAKREGIFSRDNPISEVRVPAVTRKESPNLTIIQARSVLREMKYPTREMALLTITLNMSISEIRGLQWKCVNMMHRPAHFDGEVIPPRCILVKRQRNKVGLVDVNPNRIRVVEIPEPLQRKLLSLRRAQTHATPNSFVIPSRLDAPLSAATLPMLSLRPIRRKLGMPWLSWQVLKRAHEALLSELRIQLSQDLVTSAR